jgi:hypothetical protein
MHVLIGEARRELRMTQEEFGHALGSSHRSAVRWDAGEATPSDHQLHTLARLLYPTNRALATEVADAAGGETLKSLGLEGSAPSPAPPAPATLPRAEDLVDILVLAAVELTGSSPATVRPMLHAVFRRGREVGITMEAAEKALRPPVLQAEGGAERKPKVSVKGKAGQ